LQNDRAWPRKQWPSSSSSSLISRSISRLEPAFPHPAGAHQQEILIEQGYSVSEVSETGQRNNGGIEAPFRKLLDQLRRHASRT